LASAESQTASESESPSSESASQAVDSYTPTERISEDRSVSFPVDI
jgi:hypothetical protein